MRSPYPYPPSWLGGFILGSSPLGGPNAWPVAAGVQVTIKSYLYSEYTQAYDDLPPAQGDEDIGYFVQAYNQLTQVYVDWFCGAALPVYTAQSDAMLDWVALGLYGIERPYLPSGTIIYTGAFNTYELNQLAFNAGGRSGGEAFETDDDVFKRILTWNLYLGDGKQFTIPWLKRRVTRFLQGTDGSGGGTILSSGIVMALDSFGNPSYWPNYYTVDETYSVSILFAGSHATIRLPGGQRAETGGAMFNEFVINGPGAEFNSFFTTFTPQPIPAMGSTLKAAVAAGVLELPGPYTWTVQLG